jgi:hypothetical protein
MSKVVKDVPEGLIYAMADDRPVYYEEHQDFLEGIAINIDQIATESRSCSRLAP